MADEYAHSTRGCGTMPVHRRLLDTVPRYAERLQRIEDHTFRAQMGMIAGRPGCISIPVVVHVVWKTTAENISKAQIDSQVEVLNQDFRKQNADVSNVPAPFAPLSGDACIEFELTTTDPDGSPTDGVTRRETNRNGFNTDDAVKSGATGGTDAWPSDDYLNIWVCQLTGGILGYAQFPGGPAATDGVVVTHMCFGTDGTATPPFDKGRTTTHEIGHWLNLRHIWGDDDTGCSGSDFVADTPNQSGSNSGKPTFPSVSCSNGPNGDMFMNYMDYVDDDAMFMFTEGQIARMQACLDGPRSTIGSSSRLLVVSDATLANDQPVQPPVYQPLQPPAFPRPSLPFGLDTGAAPTGGVQNAQISLLSAYLQLLSQYASLYQRGMLDAQGHSAWQQAWGDYTRLGGR